MRFPPTEDYVASITLFFSDGFSRVFGGSQFSKKDRVEKFVLAEEERLIGAEIEQKNDAFTGITFITLKRI